MRVMSKRLAVACIGDARSSEPRPAGATGVVTTILGHHSLVANASRMGTANSDVPKNAIFIREDCYALSISRRFKASFARFDIKAPFK